MSGNIPVVMCAICDKQVERLEVIEMQETKITHVVAHCHGEVDRMTLDPSTMSPQQLADIRSARGLAFTTKRLENIADDPQ